MKTVIPFFILLFLIGNLSAQSKFGLGLYFYPNVSDVVYKVDEERTSDPVDRLFDMVENPSVSYTVGLSARIDLSEKIGVSLGFGFVRTGVETEMRELTTGSGGQEPGFPIKSKFRYRHTHLETPLHLNYSIFQWGKLRLNIFGGPSLWLNIKNQNILIVELENGKRERTAMASNFDNYYSWNTILTGGVGLLYEVSDRLMVSVHPTAQTALFGMAKNVVLNRRIHSFGLTLGAVFR